MDQRACWTRVPRAFVVSRYHILSHDKLPQVIWSPRPSATCMFMNYSTSSDRLSVPYGLPWVLHLSKLSWTDLVISHAHFSCLAREGDSRENCIGHFQVGTKWRMGCRNWPSMKYLRWRVGAAPVPFDALGVEVDETDGAETGMVTFRFKSVLNQVANTTLYGQPSSDCEHHEWSQQFDDKTCWYTAKLN